jgi:hypothetical protein
VFTGAVGSRSLARALSRHHLFSFIFIFDRTEGSLTEEGVGQSDPLPFNFLRYRKDTSFTLAIAPASTAVEASAVA